MAAAKCFVIKGAFLLIVLCLTLDYVVAANELNLTKISSQGEGTSDKTQRVTAEGKNISDVTPSTDKSVTNITSKNSETVSDDHATTTGASPTSYAGTTGVSANFSGKFGSAIPNTTLQDISTITTKTTTKESTSVTTPKTAATHPDVTSSLIEQKSTSSQPTDSVQETEMSQTTITLDEGRTSKNPNATDIVTEEIGSNGTTTKEQNTTETAEETTEVSSNATVQGNTTEEQHTAETTDVGSNATVQGNSTEEHTTVTAEETTKVDSNVTVQGNTTEEHTTVTAEETTKVGSNVTVQGNTTEEQHTAETTTFPTTKTAGLVITSSYSAREDTTSTSVATDGNETTAFHYSFSGGGTTESYKSTGASDVDPEKIRKEAAKTATVVSVVICLVVMSILVAIFALWYRRLKKRYRGRQRLINLDDEDEGFADFNVHYYKDVSM